MWLDRLASQASSGSSTPQPASRPYSPASRRTPSSSLSPYVTSQRPGNSSRASSVSLISNDSSRSLLSSSRKANGSGLKQSSIVDQGTEPLEVLNTILSTGHEKEKSKPKIGSSISQADLELAFDFGGLSLKQLVAADNDDAWESRARRPQTVEECERRRRENMRS